MSSEKYQLQLNNFSGPLDLLLHLISQAKIEIKDIFVSEITDQYLNYVRNTEFSNLDEASEFLEMAATLLYIKSRALLPKEKPVNEEELSEEDKLIQRLEEYKKYKEASEKLKAYEINGREVFYKLPEEIVDEREPVILNADINLLIGAFAELLKKQKNISSGETAEVTVTHDYVSMHAQMRMITSRLKKGKGRTDFFSLFSDNPTRMEIAVTFYALLELISQGKISVAQDSVFGNITILSKDSKAND